MRSRTRGRGNGPSAGIVVPIASASEPCEADTRHNWILIFVVGDRSCSLVLFGRQKRVQSPMVPMVRSDKKPKCSVNDTCVNKKPLLRAENINALNDDINLPRGCLLTYVAGVELEP